MKFVLLILLIFPMKLTMAIPPRTAVVAIPENQLDCLVKNAYYEAMTEGKIGRQQVTKVVLNRTRDNNFCKTVYLPYQFSWTLKKQKQVPRHTVGMLRKEALLIYYGIEQVPFPRATHYHTKRVKPVWRHKLTKLGAHRAHVFYAQPAGLLRNS